MGKLIAGLMAAIALAVAVINLLELAGFSTNFGLKWRYRKRLFKIPANQKPEQALPPQNLVVCPDCGREGVYVKSRKCPNPDCGYNLAAYPVTVANHQIKVAQMKEKEKLEKMEAEAAEQRGRREAAEQKEKEQAAAREKALEAPCAGCGAVTQAIETLRGQIPEGPGHRGEEAPAKKIWLCGICGNEKYAEDVHS
ncbi:MAG: hypothetical protein FWE91_02325 [Defluviitaleaceae bacterium]|nr:hypothetical protein [Defluviitaleaceae bacterium]MCL2835143.1 hypothetical protein [Defluviitaleaceae bacterium]